MIVGLSGAATADFPAYCDWPVVGRLTEIFGSACTPDAAAQQRQIQADIQKAAGAGTPSYNPDLADEMFQAFVNDEAAHCASDPEGCAAYNNPGCATWLGTGAIAATICQNPWIWGMGAVGLLLLAGRGIR